MFNKEIKRCSLIYVTNGWAVFEGRAFIFENNFDSISLKISSPIETNLAF